MSKEILVFDVNETLLDLSPLDPVFADLFNDSGARSRWFLSMLHWSTVTTLTGRYMDFGELADHCLEKLATEHGRALTSEQRGRVFDTIAALPPHPEVISALQRLRDHGFQLAALTNSAQAMVDGQFEKAGMTNLFDHVLSVDAARCYKPHPDAYAVATRALQTAPGGLRLIACHDWDVTGALRAGLKAAFVARDARPFNTAGDAPDIIGRDLSEVADRLIAAA